MKASSRPPVRQSHSHSHSHSHSASRSRNQLSTPTALSSKSRTPASAAHAMPPSRSAALRSPSKRTDNRPSSPNYFGLVVDSSNDPRDSGLGPKDNWSPPTSSIRSFEKPSPQHLPLEFHPDLEAFRRQADSKTFSLGNLITSPQPQSHPTFESRPHLGQREISEGFPGFSDFSLPRPAQDSRESSGDVMELDEQQDREDGSARVEQNSTATKDEDAANSFFPQMSRQESPASYRTTPPVDKSRTILSSIDDKHPRLSLPHSRVDRLSPPTARDSQVHRAETLPTTLEEGPNLITAAQLKDIVSNVPTSKYLLLDLRVFPQFSTSRIQNALNLCIPTTLLKRPSFNLEKLTDTFTNEQEKARFAGWTYCEYIIVYDSFSSTKKDAVSAVNTLKKFSNEGWKGCSYILRGGFQEFSRHFPSFVDQRSSLEMQSSKNKKNLTLGSSGPAVAPVVGGCAMPTSKAPVNPFFSNIRQNMDLVGGVGQIGLKRPKDLEARESSLPTWLRQAASASDDGKLVAEKFLHIELEEQSRMQKALSGQVSYGAPTASNDGATIRIAGIEKGGKNRYNNIWPFEHARVKLKGRPDGACDYVNASHIKASRSNRRYIASQGPLPSTFEDFWSVIWDQDVRVIVMLTAESEGGQLKCHPYWASQTYGPYKLKNLSEKKLSLEPNKSRHRHNSNSKIEAGRRRANTSTEHLNVAPTPAAETPYVVVRKFTLAHSGHPFSPMREITQLHYSSWPDFGAPALPSHLLNLVELCDSLQQASASPLDKSKPEEPEDSADARPILVHCSAGCGRTGTFCTVDSVIDMLKRQRKELRNGQMEQMEVDGQQDSVPVTRDYIYNPEIDIVEKTVEDFRLQRISMVQSLRQYVLCYETVLEWMSQQIARPTRERSGSEAGISRYDAD